MIRRLGPVFLAVLMIANGIAIALAALGIFRFASSLAPSAPGGPMEALLTLSTWFWAAGPFFLWGPAFLAGGLLTLPLALGLARWRTSRRPFVRAAIAGVGMVLLACPVTGFFVGLFMPWMPSGDAQTSAEHLTMVTSAPFLFARSLGTALPALHWRLLVLGGIPFGLLNALAVHRRLAARSEALE